MKLDDYEDLEEVSVDEYANALPKILELVKSEREYREETCPVFAVIGKESCDLCVDFVNSDMFNCPCCVFGCEEAVRRTYEGIAYYKVGTHPILQKVTE